MLNIGAGEIALIVVFALLILGPKQLPELARGIGKFLREFRSRTDEVRHVVEREFYRMDEEVQALPPRSVTDPTIGRRAQAPTPPEQLNAPPVPLEQASEDHGPVPLPPPTFAAPPPPAEPGPGPIDSSFARTEANPILPPRPEDK